MRRGIVKILLLMFTLCWWMSFGYSTKAMSWPDFGVMTRGIDNNYAIEFFGNYEGEMITGYKEGTLKVGNEFSTIGAGRYDQNNTFMAINSANGQLTQYRVKSFFDLIESFKDTSDQFKGKQADTNVYPYNPEYKYYYAGQNHLFKIEKGDIIDGTTYTVKGKYIIHGNQLLSLDENDNVKYENIDNSNSIFADCLNVAMTHSATEGGEALTKNYESYAELAQYYWNDWIENGAALASKDKNLFSKLTTSNAIENYSGSLAGKISEYEGWSNQIGKTQFVEATDPGKVKADELWLDENDEFDQEQLEITSNKDKTKYTIGSFVFDFNGTVNKSESYVTIKSKTDTSKFEVLSFEQLSLDMVSGQSISIVWPSQGKVNFEDELNISFKIRLEQEFEGIQLKQCSIIYILKSNNSSPDLVAARCPGINYSTKMCDVEKDYDLNSNNTKLKVVSWLYKELKNNTYKSKSKLKNVKFMVFYSDSEIDIDNNTKCKYVYYENGEYKLSDKCKISEYDAINLPPEKATFKTDSKGVITLSGTGLNPGYYYIKELYSENKYEEPIYCYTGNIKEVYLDKGKSKSVKLVNYYNVGKLNIIKTDDDGKAWEDIKFEIAYQEEKTCSSDGSSWATCGNAYHTGCDEYYYFVKEDRKSTDSYVGQGEESETLYFEEEDVVTTNSKGRITLTKLYAGKYEITEKNLPKGYVMCVYEGGEWKEIEGTSYSVEIKPGKTTTIKIKNKKKFVSIQGCVWEENTNNNLYGDNGDKNFAGITVQLIDKNNSDNVKMTATTASNGTYKFENVLYSEIANYAVRFVYDGFTYNTVSVDKTKDKGSKGTENTTDRINLNNKFAKVQGTGTVSTTNSKTTVQAINNDGNKTLNLDYITNSDGTATYDSKYKYTISGNTITLTKDTSFTEYDVKADTDKGFSCEGRGNVEIKNINLGLKKRQQADLSIEYKLTKVTQELNSFSEDIYQDITVSGRNYDYGNINLNYQDIIALSDLELYDLGLKMTLEYEIMITNETNLNMKVYELSGIANSNLENFKIIGDNPLGLEISKADSTNKLLISTSSDQDNNVIKLSANDIFTITIQATVKEDSIKGMYNKNTNTFNDMVISNVIEINKYTTYDNSWNLYAALDKDSAVGNISSAVNSDELNNSNFAKEDDISANKITFKSGIGEEYDRIISGNVFEDLPTEEDFKKDKVNMNQERIGNGKYDNDEKKIENVLVELIDMDVLNNTYKSVNNGYSSLENFDNNIAYVYALDSDEYLDKTEIKNESGIVIAYKATAAKYTDKNGCYEFKGILPGKYLIRFVWGDKILYKYKDSEGNDVNVENLNDRNSKIEEKNVTVQDYKSTIRPEDNKGIYTDEWYTNLDLKDYSDALDNYTIREKINGECANISYNIVNNYSSKEYNLKADTEQLSISISHKGKIEGVDFGLIERPKQDIQVIKEVSYVKLALANNDPIIQGYTRDGNGNIETLSFATYLKPLSGKGGTLKMELDSELVHGSTLNVTYNIKVKNLSEKDYDDEEYYKYGIIENGETDLVKTTINQMIDYMQNDGLVCEQTDNGDWSILTNSDFKTRVEQSESESESEEDKVELQSSAKIKALKFDQILLFENSNKLDNIMPEVEDFVEIKASKMIGSSSEDLTYNNDVEVIKLYNSVGRFMTSSTPGNHVPQVTDDEGYINDEEIDNDNVDITIVPPTGETRIYYVLGITSLLIIALGVVIIKKKVIG